jgi:hypothetical protein
MQLHNCICSWTDGRTEEHPSCKVAGLGRETLLAHRSIEWHYNFLQKASIGAGAFLTYT